MSGGGGGHGSKSGQGEMGGQSSELAAFVQALLLAHQERRSWRRRLQWVRDVLSDPEVRGQSDKVATLATYLHLLATGAISCEEDGGHYRPSHHAALGLEIEQLLLGAQPRPALWLVRRMLRWLPSHDAPFRRAEPLTRIRDIAHRNDIPKELKQEIKTTLQNKLHRSAGPEDLLTSARLLERLRSQSRELPAAFLAAFSTFHLELEEFFNASSLGVSSEATHGAPSRQSNKTRRYNANFIRWLSVLVEAARGGITAYDARLTWPWAATVSDASCPRSAPQQRPSVSPDEKPRGCDTRGHRP